MNNSNSAFFAVIYSVATYAHFAANVYIKVRMVELLELSASRQMVEIPAFVNDSKMIVYASYFWSIVGVLGLFYLVWPSQYRSKFFWFILLFLGFSHLLINPLHALLLSPLWIHMLLAHKFYFHPERYEEPEVSAKERMRALREKTIETDDH